MKSKYNYIDAHSHSVDFLQKPKGLKETLKWMDKANIRAVVISGLSLKNKEKRYDYFPQTDALLAQEYLALDDEEKSHFFPLICGFNPTDENAIKQIEQTIKECPQIWHGIGEIIFRHGYISQKIRGEKPKMNHPAMDNIYQFCADMSMPILVHQNLNSKDSVPNPKALKELEETLDKNKKTIFILAHAGTAQKIYNPNHHEIIRELLSYYDNLNIDLSWKIFDKCIYRAGNSDKNWINLAQDFSERICLGSDNEENPQEIPKVMTKFNILLNSLDKKAQENLSFKTAYHLYNKICA